jgi:AraC family transcriptional regulator
MLDHSAVGSRLGHNPSHARAPDLSSQGRPWSGVVVHVYHWTAGGSITSPANDHDIVGVRLSGAVKLIQRRDGKVHSGMSSTGNVTVHPRGMESTWIWDGPGSIVLLRVPLSLLEQAAALHLGGVERSPELNNCFGRFDSFIELIAGQFADELRRPPHPVQAFTSQALSQALAYHLVHRFNCQERLTEHAARGLSPRNLARVRDFIDMHLHDHIDLPTLAAVANVSRFHFARLFKESIGTTPMAYLERLRMTRAQEIIRTTTYPLAEVATLVGYADQSYFTRRFRKLVGMTPATFARSVVVDGAFTPWPG